MLGHDDVDAFVYPQQALRTGLPHVLNEVGQHLTEQRGVGVGDAAPRISAA